MKKYQKEIDAIKAVYPTLVANLNLKDDYFLGALFEGRVITQDQKTQFDSKEYPDAQYYLLDNIIINSLQADVVLLFDRFLKVISDSSQGDILNKIADQIREKAVEDMLPVNPPPILASPTTTNTPDVSGNEVLVDDGAGGKSIDMLQLLEYMQCVCRIENSQKSDGATGFVGRLDEEYFIVTSHHAIPTEDIAMNSTFLFNHHNEHEKNPLQGGPNLFDVRSGQWFWTDKDLQYTAMKVIQQRLSQVTYSGTKIEMKISGIQMSSKQYKIEKNCILSVIHQEPIMKLSDGICVDAGANLMYKMDTGKDSEGAPIFKEQTNRLCLIAMHLGCASSPDVNHGVLMSEVVKHMKTEKYKP